MLHSMVKSSVWRNLKISSTLFLFVVQFVQGQSWELIDEKVFDAEIVSVSTDFQHNIFIALADDQLIKMNASGEVLANFSQPNLGPYTALEAQNSLNPFFFVRDNQQVVFLDRFLANPVIYDLNQWTSSFVWLATPSVDRQLWLLESDPFRISKVDRFTGNVLHEVVLQIGLDLEDLVHFSAQKQSLILVDQYRGIYLFDLFGNLRKYIAEEDAKSIQLIEDHLFYFSETSLVRLDLTTEERSTVSIPERCGTIVKNGESYLCVSYDKLGWWKFSGQ